MKSYLILKTELLGELLLTADATHLTGIFFNDCQHALIPKREATSAPAHPVLRQAAKELQEYFNGARTTFAVPLAFTGTKLQEAVWKQIARVPFGETITYTELAQRAHAPEAVRAAGTATGQNPLAIVIPCHRIIGKDGKLRGFAGGLDRKRSLLALENNLPGLKRLAFDSRPNAHAKVTA